MTAVAMFPLLPEAVVGQPLRSKNPMAHLPFSMLILSLLTKQMALPSLMMAAVKLLLVKQVTGIASL